MLANNTNAVRTIKTAILGYGYSAKTFHIPFIQCLPQFTLTAISSSKPDIVKKDLADVSVYTCVEKLISTSNAELVIITTPNDVHFSLAKRALEHGKHVVIEKPYVTNSEDGSALIALSEKYQRVLSVYHNRRWDGDFLTVKKLIDKKQLGDIRIFESRFDRFRPKPKQRWRELQGDGSGILFDLGPHLIDQTLQLFGLPKAITAQCRAIRESAEAVDFFHLLLHYPTMHAVLQSSPYCAGPNIRFSVQGTDGHYIVHGVDPQEARLKSGILPVKQNWSQEISKNYGLVYSETGTQTIVTEWAGYESYYYRLAAAINDDKPVPVTADDALQVIRIIELAMQSNDTQSTVDVPQ